MSKASSKQDAERARWKAELEARAEARLEKYKLITQHTKPRSLVSTIGGEEFSVGPRKRFDCMAVARGSGWAAVCVRTSYGDVTISRMQTGDWCYSLHDIVKMHRLCGAWIGHDQIWLSRDVWGPRSDDWNEAADFVCGGHCLGTEDDEDSPLIRSTPIQMVDLDVIEQSFDMPIARIADAAREGRLGRIQRHDQLDRASNGGQREDLSNLEAFALAMCVYAQAGDE